MIELMLRFPLPQATEVEWWRDIVGAADDSASAMTSSEAKWLTSCSDDVIKLLSVQKSAAAQSTAGIPFEADLTKEALSSTICNHTSSSSLLDSSIGRLLGNCSPTEFDVMQLLQADCIPGLDGSFECGQSRFEKWFQNSETLASEDRFHIPVQLSDGVSCIHSALSGMKLPETDDATHQLSSNNISQCSVTDDDFNWASTLALPPPSLVNTFSMQRNADNSHGSLSTQQQCQEVVPDSTLSPVRLNEKEYSADLLKRCCEVERAVDRQAISSVEHYPELLDELSLRQLRTHIQQTRDDQPGVCSSQHQPLLQNQQLPQSNCVLLTASKSDQLVDNLSSKFTSLATHPSNQYPVDEQQCLPFVFPKEHPGKCAQDPQVLLWNHFDMQQQMSLCPDDVGSKKQSNMLEQNIGEYPLPLAAMLMQRRSSTPVSRHSVQSMPHVATFANYYTASSQLTSIFQASVSPSFFTSSARNSSSVCNQRSDGVVGPVSHIATVIAPPFHLQPATSPVPPTFGPPSGQPSRGPPCLPPSLETHVLSPIPPTLRPLSVSPRPTRRNLPPRLSLPVEPVPGFSVSTGPPSPGTSTGTGPLSAAGFSGLMPCHSLNVPSPMSPRSISPRSLSPRSASPCFFQHAPFLNLSQPQSRAPSPIMFGSQPPGNVTMPMPIRLGVENSTSGQASPLMSPRLQLTPPRTGVSSPVMRVPSPQELSNLAQTILQNALIKKQLEDQKERYVRRQQERLKSVNTCTAKPHATNNASGTSVIPVFNIVPSLDDNTGD